MTEPATRFVGDVYSVCNICGGARGRANMQNVASLGRGGCGAKHTATRVSEGLFWVTLYLG
ncbi:hypothetical protein ES332_D09G189800v1 [Gossypium tomentosum]|uniref:Uncharacterized protein n=1 Tax=Gossypium tomentosum TaxID=34277 RepID=A0A5D2JJV9_GOSTO|nr:hypothetical protein ES332_D09G189800v1 [Gossypium tomentosum]